MTVSQLYQPAPTDVTRLADVQQGTGIREDFSNFNLLYVNSKIHPDEADNVNIIDLLTLSANPELGVLVTEDYHPEAEINSAENRLTLSELIWGAYQETAGIHSPRPFSGSSMGGILTVETSRLGRISQTPEGLATSIHH